MLDGGSSLIKCATDCGSYRIRLGVLLGTLNSATSCVTQEEREHDAWLKWLSDYDPAPALIAGEEATGQIRPPEDERRASTFRMDDS